EQADALDKLEGFASLFGPDFYDLPRNSKTITLQKMAWQPPESYQFGKDKVVPLGSGETINWQLVR
ncbi:MAG: dihydroorotase, partial [Candidatus Thiodiazotropha sp. (ex Lucinoma borealis)]|nr:dihydroorotase [Candidatus Thiodiazotropha sp. (ex Lucinoma borealis)]